MSKDYLCVIKGINLFKEYQNAIKEKNPKILYVPFHNCFLDVGYFDGASSNGEFSCGMILFLNNDHFFNPCLGGGLVSNTKVELLSLFGLLHFASLIGILDINICGDSQVIIDWLNGSSNLHVLLLKHWI